MHYHKKLDNADHSHSNRALGATVSHKVADAKFMVEAFRLWTTLIAELPSDFTYYFIPQGINSNMVRAGRSRNGGNLFGLQDVAQNCELGTPVPVEDVRLISGGEPTRGQCLCHLRQSI